MLLTLDDFIFLIPYYYSLFLALSPCPSTQLQPLVSFSCFVLLCKWNWTIFNYLKIICIFFLPPLNQDLPVCLVPLQMNSLGESRCQFLSLLVLLLFKLFGLISFFFSPYPRHKMIHSKYSKHNRSNMKKEMSLKCDGCLWTVWVIITPLSFVFFSNSTSMSPHSQTRLQQYIWWVQCYTEKSTQPSLWWRRCDAVSVRPAHNFKKSRQLFVRVMGHGLAASAYSNEAIIRWTCLIFSKKFLSFFGCGPWPE